MPKRIKHLRQLKEIKTDALDLLSLSTQAAETISLPTKAQISALMSSMGRKGGKIGGKRRLETMTAKERKRIAKMGAKARWSIKE